MYERHLKRVLDLLIALIGLPFFLVFYLVIGILIKLEDGGSVLYKSERIGKDSRLFSMYKFRSMKVDAQVVKS